MKKINKLTTNAAFVACTVVPDKKWLLEKINPGTGVKKTTARKSLRLFC